jgi:hypothetical protein
MGQVLIVRATKKLLQRLRSATLHEGESGTASLGQWYATALPWRPQQLIMLVNEQTLLPVLMPLAPAATVPARIGPAIAAVLAAHRVPADVVEAETIQMRDCRFGHTASRSVVGVMNEFAKLADVDLEPARRIAQVSRNASVWSRMRAGMSTASSRGSA